MPAGKYFGPHRVPGNDGDVPAVLVRGERSPRAPGRPRQEELAVKLWKRLTGAVLATVLGIGLAAGFGDRGAPPAGVPETPPAASIDTVPSMGGDGDLVAVPGPTWDATPEAARAGGRQLPRGGTYLLVKPKTGEVVYNGRSNDLRRREGEHGRSPELGRFEFRVDKRTDDYAQQRGREQIVHERYQPPLNRREPISPSNPRRDDYLREGRKLGR